MDTNVSHPPIGETPPARARKTAKRASSTHDRKPRPAATRAARQAARRPPLVPLDKEMLSELGADLLRRAAALAREKPIVAFAGVFAAGFVVGGGWRTRLGRFLVLAAARHLVVEGAKQYFTA